MAKTDWAWYRIRQQRSGFVQSPLSCARNRWDYSTKPLTFAFANLYTPTMQLSLCPGPMARAAGSDGASWVQTSSQPKGSSVSWESHACSGWTARLISAPTSMAMPQSCRPAAADRVETVRPAAPERFWRPGHRATAPDRPPARCRRSADSGTTSGTGKRPRTSSKTVQLRTAATTQLLVRAGGRHPRTFARESDNSQRDLGPERDFASPEQGTPRHGARS